MTGQTGDGSLFGAKQRDVFLSEVFCCLSGRNAGGYQFIRILSTPEKSLVDIYKTFAYIPSPATVRHACPGAVIISARRGGKKAIAGEKNRKKAKLRCPGRVKEGHRRRKELGKSKT